MDEEGVCEEEDHGDSENDTEWGETWGNYVWPVGWRTREDCEDVGVEVRGVGWNEWLQVSLVERVVCNGRVAKSEDSRSGHWSAITSGWMTWRLAERLTAIQE